MKQALHIFRKDARRFWPEILVSMAALVALIWICPYTWRAALPTPGGHAPSGMRSSVLVFFPEIVTATWFFLITRVVQAERLVGDTQFWVTRPYGWKSLLAAKVLFLAVFVYFPLVVVQCVLLLRAGFHPHLYVGGLVYDLLLITAVLVAPIFAMACVTRSLAWTVLTLLGVLAGLATFFSLGMLILPVNAVVLPWADPIPQLLCLCLCVAAIVLQYAGRRTGAARLVLLSTPVWVLLFSVLSPYAVDRAYGQRDQGDSASVALVYSPQPNVGYPASVEFNREIVFGIPLSVVKAPDHTIPVVANVRIAIEAADGTRWVSPWEGSFGGAIVRQNTALSVLMPQTVYRRFHGKPLLLQLTLAVAEAREQSSARIPLGSYETPIPGSICSVTGGWAGDANFRGQKITFGCIYPLRTPWLSETALVSDSSCSTAGDVGSGNFTWMGGLGAEPASLAIDPIWAGATSSSESDEPRDQPETCRITGVVFTQYRLARRVETTVTIRDFELPPMS
jgi:hypothetical protein